MRGDEARAVGELIGSAFSGFSGHVAIPDAVQERDLAAAVAQELVDVSVAPVLLDAGAEAHVLDPRAEQIRAWPGTPLEPAVATTGAP